MENQPPWGATPATGATCAQHPDQVAGAICARCGNFMCPTCTENDVYDACPACRAITGDLPGFVWTRDNFSLDGLLTFAWERFKREWVMLSLAALVFGVTVFGFSLVSSLLQNIGTLVDPIVGVGLAVVGSIAQSIFQATLMGGLVVVLYDVMKGRPVDLARLFSQFSRLGTYATVTLLMLGIVLVGMLAVGAVAGIAAYAGGTGAMWIAVAIASVLVLVPGVWFALPFMFVEMEVALGGERSGLQAVKHAFKLAEGKRLWMLLVWLLSGIMLLGGLVLCCVGVLPALALTSMLKTGLYLALRNGLGLPPLRGQL